jgi:hypothetical protein
MLGLQASRQGSSKKRTIVGANHHRDRQRPSLGLDFQRTIGHNTYSTCASLILRTIVHQHRLLQTAHAGTSSFAVPCWRPIEISQAVSRLGALNEVKELEQAF